MHTHLTRILPVAAMIALAACQSNPPAQDAAAIADSLRVDSLSAEVMSIHDESMAKMMTIRRLQTRLTEVTDSLGKLKKDTTAVSAANVRLDSANAAMHAWMEGYDLELKGKTMTEKKAYLESEKEKIKKVGDQMQESIGNAKQLLGQP
ncbi:hypothetical protein ACWKWU_10445 [Chitinophaga lutea]